MKKLKYLLLMILFFCTFSFVKANEIYSIDVSLELDNEGNGKVTEIWNMYVNQGTEVYKPMGDLGNSEITNFHVSDGITNYESLSSWSTSGTLNSKAYKNGINYTDEALELCWGMSSYGNHTYVITYDVSNMIYEVDEAQVLYWKFINDSMDPAPKKFSVTVFGPSSYEDTLDVWGYGYEGYAYVEDGFIKMSNIENRNFKSSEYAVLLVKYPLNTFNTDNSTSKFHTFDDFYEQAESGSFKFDNKKVNIFKVIFIVIFDIISFIFPFLIIIFVYKGAKASKINYVKKPLENVNNFRDIPCDKDVFRAFFLSDVYNLNSKKEDLLGAVLLKWIRDGQIKIIKQEKKKMFGTKEITALDLTKSLEGNELEKSLYKMMQDASKDLILEEDELKKWCKNNYSKFFKWFDNVLSTVRNNYIKSSDITVTESGKVFKSKSYVIGDRLHEEAIKLSGLKKYLKEFSRIKEKEPIEVMLWQEYLIFAQIFGIAKEVSKQFKNLYPEVFENTNYNIDYFDIIWINSITTSSISSASSARSAAQSYSSGGGGFSSGGGGGSSFGGGSGGGCR